MAPTRIRLKPKFFGETNLRDLHKHSMIVLRLGVWRCVSTYVHKKGKCNLPTKNSKKSMRSFTEMVTKMMSLAKGSNKLLQPLRMHLAHI